MSQPLHQWSAVQLARALATRELSAARLAAALIERCAALEPQLHAWAWFDADAALRQARALDGASASGVLHGLPIGVKDIIDTAGIPTAYGSAIHAGHVPAADAACVALARAAGAWVLGKTASTEFANMTPGPTRNPHDGAHTPGGSSSGSAAAVACGMVPLALGTQTAGSVIRPAAFCGIVGYKPSPRRIPRSGTLANADSLDEVGVLARTVDDASLLAGVLGGRADAQLASAQAFIPRIGVTLTSRQAQLSIEMVAMLSASAQRLSAAGAGVHDVVWPASFDALFEAQRSVQLFETARALALELQNHRLRLSAALAGFLDEGLRVEPASYAAALASGRAAAGTLEALFSNVDVLIAPAAPGAAPRGLSSTGDPAFSRPWQLLGCPCVAIPGGVGMHRMPLGLQVIGRPNDDHRTLAAAAWIGGQLRAEEALRART